MTHPPDQLLLFELEEIGGLQPLIVMEMPAAPILTAKICERVYLGDRCTEQIPKGRRKYCSAHCAWLQSQEPHHSDAYYARKHRREIRMERSRRTYIRIAKRSNYRLG